MKDILGLGHFNKTDGTSKLLAVFGGDVFIYNEGTNLWEPQTQGLSTTAKVEWENFCDKWWMVNYDDATRYYDGSSWTQPPDVPQARYIKRFNNRLYLGNCKYPTISGFSGTTEWPSRIFYSDLPENKEITWGLEAGTDLVQTANSSVVTSASALFETRNIETGDPFFITSGANQGVYTVDSVDSETQITLVETLDNSATGSHYWVGDNWADINTDDGDVIMGLGENSNRLLIFKQDSLYRYSSFVWTKVPGGAGTVSHRSIANWRGNTYYFHRDGIYKYDGVSSTLISNAIQDYIDGISGSFFSNICGTTKRNHYYAIVGDITNSEKDISISNAMIDYDISQKHFYFHSLADVPRVFTGFLESGIKNLYFGTNEEKVFKWLDGNSDAGEPIHVELETRTYYPVGPEYINQFHRILIFTQNGMGLKIQYKIVGNPDRDQDVWESIGNIHGDYFEKRLEPSKSRGRGIKFRISESSTLKPFLLEGITVFYTPVEKVEEEK